jgi:hypothetical protein
MTAHFKHVLFAGAAIIGLASLGGCATTGDSAQSSVICHALDGTIVSLSDPRCPPETRNALHAGGAQISNESIIKQNSDMNYNMENHLVPGDNGYRQ